MNMTEKIPKAMAEKFSAIAALTDAFCAQHLHAEYRRTILHVLGALARKRPSPLLRGKENVWAAAAVHAVGRVNFLDDPAQTPRCKPKLIYAFFGIAESTGQNKSKEVLDLLAWDRFRPNGHFQAGSPQIPVLERTVARTIFHSAGIGLKLCPH